MFEKKSRVKINMGLFFRDYRSKVFIFLDVRMRLVADLEEHVGRLFGITNFCFSLGDYFVPSSENIEILQPEVSLKMHPKPADHVYPSIVSRPELSQRAPVENKECQTEDVTNWIGEEPQPDKMECKPESEPTKEPKQDARNKSETKKEVSRSMRILEDCIFTGTKPRITNKMQITNGDKAKQVEREPKSAPTKDVENKSETKKEVSKSMRILEDYFFTGTDTKQKMINKRQITNGDKVKHVTVKKRKTDLICLDLPKQRNIVKSLIVSKMPGSSIVHNSDDSALSMELQTPELANSEQVQLVADEKQEKSNSAKVDSYNREHSAGPNKTSENDVSSVVSSAADKEESSVLLSNSDNDGGSHIELGSKRRKRHRKRKHKDKASSTPRSIDEPTSFKPPSTIAAPSMHIRFDDAEPATNQSASETCENQLETVTVDDSDGEALERAARHSPHMTNTLPRTGDVISFKFLRMNPNYEPEVSEPVTGRVLEYVAEKDEVCVHLMHGAEQCVEPDGKFSLPGDEAPPAVTEKSFQWKNLIEPKLLYP